MEVLKSASEQTASEYGMSEIKLEVSHIRKQFDGEEVRECGGPGTSLDRKAALRLFSRNRDVPALP